MVQRELLPGAQCILPDGSRVRAMQADSKSPRRASFENANDGPVDPTTGKPPQPLQLIQSTTKIVQFSY